MKNKPRTEKSVLILPKRGMGSIWREGANSLPNIIRHHVGPKENCEEHAVLYNRNTEAHSRRK